LKKPRNSKKKENLATTDGKEDYNGLTETFFLTFVGELVEVAGSFYHGDQENAIKIAGFVLDVDDEYYYLGDTPEEITQAIRRDRVIYIQILEPINPYLDALKELEVPEDETKQN
jgi:hypothetical protein